MMSFLVKLNEESFVIIALLNKVRYSESLALTGFHRWMLYLIISINAIFRGVIRRK